MPFVVAWLAVFGMALASGSPVPADAFATTDAFAVAAAQPPPGGLPMETEPAERGWGNPAVWITIGAVTLVLLLIATLMSLRGRGRTVLKE